MKKKLFKKGRQLLNPILRIRWRQLLSSFQVQVLLSYIPLVIIFVIWTRVYLSIDHRRDSLTEKIRKLENIENRYLDNKSLLDAFLLRGYRDDDFYLKGGESNINHFLSTQLQLQNAIRKLKFEFAEEGLDIESEIDSMFVLNTRFVRSIEYLKTLMYERGYLTSGVEGQLSVVADQLQEQSQIPIKTTATLHNLTQDFLRQGNPEIAEEFNRVAESALQSRRLTADSKQLLAQYQNLFNKIVELDSKIGINMYGGAYAEVQNEMLELRGFYEYMLAQVKERSEAEFSKYRLQLWLISIVMVAILLIVSVFLSRDLTNDVRILNRKVFSFIRSEFKSYRYQQFKPRNTEIANLNRNFDELIDRLTNTLKRIEEEKQRAEKTAEYKSLFLANMSHEIRTPLNGVIGMLHMLHGTRLNQKQKQYMEVVDYSANHLLELVNMILDHSKLDAKKMQLEEIEFDLAGDMAKLVKIFEFKTREKGLSISFKAKGDFNQKLIGDSLRLQQVLMNLLNNAIKFTEKGKIVLSIEELERSAENVTVKFSVADSGIGISQAHQTRLFEAFEQLDGSTTRQYGGTGLGLAISNQLVQMMGSKINLKSEEGHGAKFCFDISFKIGQNLVRKIETKSKEDTKEGVRTGIRVLLAEDNPVNQKVLSLMLQQTGAEVKIANNGLEAVELYKEDVFDIVLMDLQMPEMDGLEASGVIKALPRYKKYPTPIIAVTANAFVEDRKRALKAGMDDFLTKPIRPQEFKGMLAKYAPDLLVE